MKMKLLLLLVILLSACSSSVGTKKLGSEDSVKKFMSREGVEKSAIIAKYGEPVRKFSDGKLDVYEYRKITISDRIVSYVPIVAMIADAFIGTEYYEYENLFAYFDGEKLVKFDTIYLSDTYRRK